MASSKRLLILGGTSEARDLAARLAGQPGLEVITSLAGRTSDPLTPEGRLRRGGFGGSKGLQDYLVAEQIFAVVDATHPFAATISRHCTEACDALALPQLVFHLCHRLACLAQLRLRGKA